MIKSHTKQKAGKLCGILIFTLLLVFIPAFIFDFYYDMNDDTAIKDIISGTYTGTPSGYSIQMLYPLSWIIAVFYRAIPAAPWYGLFLCLCQFGVFVLIGWRLLNIFKSITSKFVSIAFLLIIVLGIFTREIVFIQYSVTSAICMVGALFLFVTCERTQRVSKFIKNNIIPVVLVVVSFMIRTEMCLMLMPFLVLAVLVKWASEEKIFSLLNVKKYILVSAMMLVGMLAVYSVDKVAYSSSEWNSFRTFFDARTNLYDFYGLPSYEGENEEFYNSIGLSKESYTLLENYNFAIDESIDSWMLKSISDYQRQQAGITNSLKSTFGYISKNNLKEALWLYKKNIISGATNPVKLISDLGIKGIMLLAGEAIVGYAIILAYLIYIIGCFSTHNGKIIRQAFIKIIAVLFIRSVLWLYLYMLDRVLTRVTVPLLMMELCMIVLFIMNDMGHFKLGKNVGIVSGMITVLFFALSVIINYNAVNTEYTLRAQADARWNSLVDYCGENIENYYVIDVYSSTSYNGVAYSEKIFKNVDNSYRNFDICGGWIAKSPLYRQKLARSGIKDVQSALYSNKAYFIAECDKDLTWIGEYYGKRGYNVVPVCEDIIYTDNNEAAFMVYKLSE
jgi:hypothetical protein